MARQFETPKNKAEALMKIVAWVVKVDAEESLNKIPRWTMIYLFTRILAYAGKHGHDVDGAFADKTAFNAVRPDHQKEARLAAGGKQW